MLSTAWKTWLDHADLAKVDFGATLLTSQLGFLGGHTGNSELTAYTIALCHCGWGMVSVHNTGSCASCP